MKQHIKLKEIIWEICDACFQNCSYCGSKDDINKTPIDNEKIVLMVDNIAMFPPEEIDISGGNPLLVSNITHQYLTSTLKRNKVVCKILVNPFNVKGSDVKTLKLYDWVGVSINTATELNRAMNGQFVDKFGFTVITNFNTSNIFLFKDIEEYVIRNNLQWQIQYTMYKDKNELAIYSNTEAVAYFNNLVKASKADIILADNCNQGDCSAGLYSLGILANGDVVPCLSMRAWEDEITRFGNLLESSLAHIWIHNFAAFRYSEFKCCKDVTKCKEAPIQKLPPYAPPTRSTERYPVETNIVMMYGIQQPAPFYDYPSMTCVYAVQVRKESPITSEPNVYAYAVVKPTITTNNPTYDPQFPKYGILGAQSAIDGIQWLKLVTEEDKK